MTGRGIDQVLPHPSNPELHEPYVKNAMEYVHLAEVANGKIQKPVDFHYVWGDSLEALERIVPDARIINLETAVTSNDRFWRGKDIHYRMHPKNIPVLEAISPDCCVLANNHILDWGYAGLDETLSALEAAKLNFTGAGQNREQAQRPTVVPGKNRVLVFSFGTQSSGVPADWAAGKDQAGVSLLPDYSDKTVNNIAAIVNPEKQTGDIVVISLHWGSNWGYSISQEESRFAYKLIDVAGADVIHGHSSHHIKGIEVYREKLILYGCGDFLNDYEGISGYEQFRDYLGLMYFPTISPIDGQLVQLRLIPTRIERFRVKRANEDETQWLEEVLNREGSRLGTRVERSDDGSLMLRVE